MESGRAARWALLVLLAGVLVSGSGCAYLENRGNDFADIFDVGVTVSSKPKICVYASFLGLLSLGYSNFDGTLHGLADCRVGALPAVQHAGGVLLWGYERFEYGEAQASEAPAGETPGKGWDTGIVGLAMGPRAPANQLVNCPKMLHLGWVGLTLNCKFAEVADFLLGWTTLDILSDDHMG